MRPLAMRSAGQAGLGAWKRFPQRVQVALRQLWQEAMVRLMAVGGMWARQAGVAQKILVGGGG
jgi:hypothetical protein